MSVIKNYFSTALFHLQQKTPLPQDLSLPSQISAENWESFRKDTTVFVPDCGNPPETTALLNRAQQQISMLLTLSPEQNALFLHQATENRPFYLTPTEAGAELLFQETPESLLRGNYTLRKGLSFYWMGGSFIPAIQEELFLDHALSEIRRIKNETPHLALSKRTMILCQSLTRQILTLIEQKGASPFFSEEILVRKLNSLFTEMPLLLENIAIAFTEDPSSITLLLSSLPHPIVEEIANHSVFGISTLEVLTKITEADKERAAKWRGIATSLDLRKYVTTTEEDPLSVVALCLLYQLGHPQAKKALHALTDKAQKVFCNQFRALEEKESDSHTHELLRLACDTIVTQKLCPSMIKMIQKDPVLDDVLEEGRMFCEALASRILKKSKKPPSKK